MHHKKNNKLILRGPRNYTNGLCDVILKPTTQEKINNQEQHVCNNVYKLSIKKDIVAYFHAAGFSPVASTWKKAIR